MKIRTAKKIMNYYKRFYGSKYWLWRWGYYCGMKSIGKNAGDHCIIKAISLTSKKRKMRIKDTDTFVDLSKEDKDALDTWAHYCKQHEGYERNEEGN